MKELIEHALQLIEDRPEIVEIIHHVLQWDDEMKVAFNIAYDLKFKKDE